MAFGNVDAVIDNNIVVNVDGLITDVVVDFVDVGDVIVDVVVVNFVIPYRKWGFLMPTNRVHSSIAYLQVHCYFFAIY